MFLMIPVLFLNSYLLIGFDKDLLRLYFCLDNLFLMMTASDITYVCLNFYNNINYVTASMICYPILDLVICGNFRVMLRHARMTKWKVIGYKLVKFIGYIYYLIYGSYYTLNEEFLPY